MKKILPGLGIFISLILISPLAFATTYTLTNGGPISGTNYYTGTATLPTGIYYFSCPTPLTYDNSGTQTTITDITAPVSITDNTIYGTTISTSSYGGYQFTVAGAPWNWSLAAVGITVNFHSSSLGNESIYCGGTGDLMISDVAPNTPSSTFATSNYDSNCLTQTVASGTLTTCDDPLKTQAGGLISFFEIGVLVFFGTWFIMWHGKKEIS